MKQATIRFDLPARRVYTGCLRALKDCGLFRNVEGNEQTFCISATKGLPIFGERLSIRVVASSTDGCDVNMKSTDKLFFNPFKFGNNIMNVRDMSDFIRNEVYRYLKPEQLGVNTSCIKIAEPRIRIVQPDIEFKRNV